MAQRESKFYKPLLRWAGGKNWITKHILNYIPQTFNNYFEPFVGGASIALYLKHKNKLMNNVSLSDSNPRLINFYSVLQKYPNEIVSELKKYKNEKMEYYNERERKYSSEIKNAAQFYYLNRTSFNGIYRENLAGKYNVPYGYKQYKTLFDIEKILCISSLIQDFNFDCNDFSTIENNIGTRDLVFLDPPYTVAHENNGFIKYNQKIFSWEDQIRLKDLILHIDSMGSYYILTNAFHHSILELYNGIGNKTVHERISVIGGSIKSRNLCKELIISNVEL